MKKILFLIPIIPLLICCADFDVVDIPTNNEEFSHLQLNYSYEEIVEIANSIANELDRPQGRSGTRTANIASIQDYKFNSSRAEESNLCIVNYEDNKGFAVISKIRCADPVLAVINEGSFTGNTTNPGFNLFMERANGFIGGIRDTNRVDIEDPNAPKDTNKVVITPATRYKTVRDTLSKTIIPSKIQYLKWGQKKPEGTFCKYEVCGCAPTAMAMIITHFSVSKSYIYYTYADCDVDYDEVDWNILRQHETSGFLSYFCCNDITHEKIGRFCRQLGEDAHSTYWPTGQTSTSTKYIKPTLSRYLPLKNISDFKTYNYIEVLPHLKNGLVLMDGLAYCSDRYNNKLPTDTVTGHVWVADGCYYTKVNKKTYRKTASDSDWVLDTSIIEETKLISFNWGWEGMDNSTNLDGYYHAGVFNPSVLGGKRYFDCRYLTIE